MNYLVADVVSDKNARDRYVLSTTAGPNIVNKILSPLKTDCTADESDERGDQIFLNLDRHGRVCGPVV